MKEMEVSEHGWRGRQSPGALRVVRCDLFYKTIHGITASCFFLLCRTEGACVVVLWLRHKRPEETGFASKVQDTAEKGEIPERMKAKTSWYTPPPPRPPEINQRTLSFAFWTQTARSCHF